MAKLEKRKSFMLEEGMESDISFYVKTLNVSEGEYIRQAIRRHLLHTALVTFTYNWGKNVEDKDRDWNIYSLWESFKAYLPAYTAEHLLVTQFETYVMKEFGSVENLITYVRSA